MGTTAQYKGITVHLPDLVDLDELKDAFDAEIADWASRGKEIASFEVTIDGDDYVIQCHERSPIKRIRRITGYCVEIDRFNAAKMAEARDRVTHV